ncbi:hypothetical protein [Enterococcus sp. LJL51]|uniref:hypothetical protein n=1 Tax=Enterococcus sp. LJL51 TaxID=3416656 RepID=UPI003CED2F7B
MGKNILRQKSSVQGCGYLFLLALILIIPIGFGVVKVSDNLFNNPNEQILSQLPNFIEVPSYDPKDDFPMISESEKASKNEMWYEIRIQAANQKEYLYSVKVVIRKKLFLQPKLNVTEVIEH